MNNDDHGFHECLNAVFGEGMVDDTTKKFLRELWELAYRQGSMDQSEKIILNALEGVN